MVGVNKSCGVVGCVGLEFGERLHTHNMSDAKHRANEDNTGSSNGPKV